MMEEISRRPCRETESRKTRRRVRRACGRSVSYDHLSVWCLMAREAATLPQTSPATMLRSVK